MEPNVVVAAVEVAVEEVVLDEAEAAEDLVDVEEVVVAEEEVLVDAAEEDSVDVEEEVLADGAVVDLEEEGVNKLQFLIRSFFRFY